MRNQSSNPKLPSIHLQHWQARRTTCVCRVAPLGNALLDDQNKFCEVMPQLKVPTMLITKNLIARQRDPAVSAPASAVPNGPLASVAVLISSVGALLPGPV